MAEKSIIFQKNYGALCFQYRETILLVLERGKNKVFSFSNKPTWLTGQLCTMCTYLSSFFVIMSHTWVTACEF